VFSRDGEFVMVKDGRSCPADFVLLLLVFLSTYTSFRSPSFHRREDQSELSDLVVRPIGKTVDGE